MKKLTLLLIALAFLSSCADEDIQQAKEAYDEATTEEAAPVTEEVVIVEEDTTTTTTVTVTTETTTDTDTTTDTEEETVLGSFTDNGDGTITQTASGLIWAQTTEQATYNQDQAESYCIALGDPWRLPLKAELLALISQGEVGLVDPLFLEAVAGYYWTNDLASGSPARGWVVSFYDGSTGSAVRSAEFYVRCVK